METWLRTVAPGLVLLLDEEEQAEALAAALRSYAARESLEQDSTAKDGAAGKDRPEKGAADQDGTDKDRLDKDRPDKDSADTKTNAWPRPVVVCVGPEGGWDDSERQSFVQRVGAVPVTLGPRILRTETAGLVGATAVFYHFHALGG
ncbi:RsmE family RNA methyltransferase [Alicyclobacillus curvatus]|nr:RsmE family RNA methyltransferase [Alicyclobacillus curvatus]